MKISLKIFFLLNVLFLIFPFVSQAASTLTIVPVLFEDTALPGQVLKKKIKVINDDNQEKEILINIQDFVAKGEEGQQEFLPFDPERRTFSLAAWIYPEERTFVIGPGQEKEIKLNIEIPEDAEAGGHYAAVFFGPKVIAGAPGMVTTIGQVGSLFLLRVAGPIEEKAEIKEFSSSRRFYQSPPVDFSIRLENKGNVHLKPKGEIIIKNIFKRKAGEVEVNSKGGSVLPQSIRKYQSSWTKKWTIGRYTALANVKYGNSNQLVQKEISFWVIPVVKLLIGFLVLGIIIILIIFSIKRYNQWIIKKVGLRTFAK